MNQYISTHSDQFLVVLGFFLNTFVSLIAVKNISPDSVWVKALHLLVQGFVKVDPIKDGVKPENPTLLVLVFSVAMLPAFTGCTWLKQEKICDAAQNLCVTALSAQPEVKDAAATRKLAVGDWSEYICHFDDVYELFVKDTALRASSPITEAITRARAHGAL
jgi:hypothetical protein